MLGLPWRILVSRPGVSRMTRVALPFGSRTPETRRHPYRKALAAANIQPVENVATLAGLDGLVLAGGSDVDPALYGAPPHPETGEPDRDRDSLETAYARHWTVIFRSSRFAADCNC